MVIEKKVMFCIELVNITLKQGTVGLNQMYLQFVVYHGKNKVMHRNIFAPQQRSYGIVAICNQNVK